MTTLCDVIDNCTECPRYGDDCDGDKRLYTHEEAWGMCDLISRADAIEAACNEMDWLDDGCVEERKTMIKDALTALPSAEAEQGVGRYENAMQKLREMPRYLNGVKEKQIKKIPSEAEWIPCSERLPSESGDYLCTIPLDAEETYTEVLTFHKGRFYEDDDEWGATYHDDILAWMPLPKPYREDGET